VTDETWGIRFSPDDRRIATASDDGKVRLWDAKTGALEHTFDGHRGMASTVAFSPDGKRLASGGQDLAVHLWDAEKRTAVRKLEGHTVWVSDVAFTPDGTRIVSVGGNWTEEASDGLRVWDAADGTALYPGAPGRTQDVGLAVGPDGRYAVTGGMNGALWEWRLPEGPKK
jgi:WD40 repeat protein